MLYRIMKATTVYIHKMPKNVLKHITEEGGVLHKCIAREVCCLEKKMSKPHESTDTEQC